MYYKNRKYQITLKVLDRLRHILIFRRISALQVVHCIRAILTRLKLVSILHIKIIEYTMQMQGINSMCMLTS